MQPRTRSYRSTALIAVCLGLSAMAAGDNVLPGDAPIARFVQRAPETPFADVATFGNWIGSSRTFAYIALAIALMLFILRRPWEALLVILAFAARGTNGVLKDLASSPRPTPDLVRVTEIANGLGFPSGHAMGSTLGFGAIALLAPRLIPHTLTVRVVQGACVALVATVCFGRIYTGAHWPTDVLGGVLWGSLMLYELTVIVTTLQARRAAAGAVPATTSRPAPVVARKGRRADR